MYQGRNGSRSLRILCSLRSLRSVADAASVRKFRRKLCRQRPFPRFFVPFVSFCSKCLETKAANPLPVLRSLGIRQQPSGSRRKLAYDEILRSLCPLRSLRSVAEAASVREFQRKLRRQRESLRLLRLLCPLQNRMGANPLVGWPPSAVIHISARYRRPRAAILQEYSSFPSIPSAQMP